MFVQVIRGRVHDIPTLDRLMARWLEELAPTADGWLGMTSGVTDDGELATVVRFASREAADRNGARPEQDAWWQEVAKVFDAPPAFLDSEEIVLLGGGGTDAAGFVQVMEGRITDLDAFRAAVQRWAASAPTELGRSDLLGATSIVDADAGRFTQVVYFSSEEEARAGEQAEMPEEIAEQMAAFDAAVEDIVYLDLRDPQLRSPA
jgi:hypothetical protein